MIKETDYIYNIPKFTKKASLDNTRELLRRLGNPGLDRKIIHVAGTNGKGSVCTYLDNILREAGHTTALFTSPHLVRINERIVIEQQEVSDKQFEEAFYAVKKAAVEMSSDGYVHPSFFEFLFGMAMYCFGKSDAEYIILETGLGGRLDATNVIPKPLLTIITSISLDHTDILGDTYELIAKEKARIIKKGVPVIFPDKRKDVTDVILHKVGECDAKPVILNLNEITHIVKKDKYIDFCFDNRYYGKENFRVVSGGIYQPENASLAILAAKQLGISDVEIVRKGLLRARWIGRMQEVSDGVIIDGAHNDDGIACFLRSVSLDNCRGRRILLFSAVKDKHFTGMIKEIVESGLFDKYFVAQLDDTRALKLDIIEDTFHDFGVSDIKGYIKVETAYNEAVMEKQPDDIIYIAGSLYLAGEILSFVKK